MLNGDRPLQIVEDPTPFKRPYLLLPLPDIARSQIHPFGKCSAQRLEAQQSSVEHNLRSEGIQFNLITNMNIHYHLSDL